jgi:hypothetical protein
VKEKTFFSVASVGKNRWYWVVWPALETLQGGQAGRHLAEGVERTKAEAVDRALERAGLRGEWVAAKYAKDYYDKTARKQSKGEPDNWPVKLEFLYRDIQEPSTEEWYSIPHRIVRKTRKFIFVEQRPYEPERLSGSWLDYNPLTFRLDRTMLEREGYALTPILEGIEDPLFFSMPYLERLRRYSHEAPACLRVLRLSFPCSVAEVKATYRKLVKQTHPDQGGRHDDFLALQAAYEQALRLCRYKPE